MSALSARLWAASADQAAAAAAHPFVRGLATGDLPLAAFQGYVAQDAFFLEAFARAYALGAARSPDRAALEAFAGLLSGVCDELRLHDGYAQRWGVDLSATRPLAATSAYTEFLLATAARGGTGLLCAATTPCMRLYAELAAPLDPVAAGRYGEWVRTYADPAFAQLAATLEGLLDRHGDDGPQVAATYRQAMDLELGFFDASL